MFKEFLKHLFPRVVLQQNLRISYSFCLGGLAFTALLVLALSGLLLLFYYRPGAAEAYPSIIFLEESVYGGKYLRNLHRLASHAFLVCMFLHILRVVLTGAFAPPRQRNWIIGICLLGLGMFEAYTGYLLPMDQLALWATQTGMTLLEAAPLGRSGASMRKDSFFSSSTASRTVAKLSSTYCVQILMPIIGRLSPGRW